MRDMAHTELPSDVLDYIELVERGRACKDQKALAAYIRRVFEQEALVVDLEQIGKYQNLVRYFPYGDLFPWQKFVRALWNCTYTKAGLPRWKTLLCMVGRGAGKDGFIAYDSMCSVSPFNPVARYNVDICANNEDQAMTPLKDLIDALESPKHEAKLKKHFYHTKELIQGRKNKGIVRGRTNNPKGRDGMRSGKVIFNEVHAFENYDNIKVFVTGQGKVAQPRVGIFTSNGEVSDGPLDDYIARGMRILFEGEDDKGFLPFICRLNALDDVHDPENWCMANPSLPYLPNLMQETLDEYHDWCDHPEQNGDFIVKRMGLRQGVKELAVTAYENVQATNRPLPQNMDGWVCTVGIDYAQISDWAAVNAHFVRGQDRFDLNHAWLCTASKDLARIRAPWRDWANAGHLTVVDDVSIPPEMIARYVQELGERFSIARLAMDHFRWPLMADALCKIGFDARDNARVKLVRPSDISRVDPIIQECFNRRLFVWGDQPVLRWATNNTKRVKSGVKSADTGNFVYAKIEAKSRKTDPFMALAASMVCEDALLRKTVELPDLGAIVL